MKQKKAKQAEEIKIGDYVTMNDRYRVSEKNKGRVFKVVSEPQDIGGTTCVFLDDYRGAYAADGLTKVHAVCSDKTAEKTSDVSRATTIKQLVGLSVSNISEEKLEELVLKVKLNREAVNAIVAGFLSEGKMDKKTYAQKLEYLRSQETQLHIASANFATVLLGQVFTWLEGAGK